MDQIDLLRYTIETLVRLGIPYLVVGSYASSAWGETRYTNDIDIVVELRRDQIKPFCLSFSGPEFYVSEAAAHEAVTYRKQFNVLHPVSGCKVDLMIARDDLWSRSQMQRGRIGQMDDFSVRFCSPEDTIISKMRYYKEGESPKHLRDIAGVLRVQGDSVDREEIARWAESLNLLDIWKSVLSQPKLQ